MALTPAYLVAAKNLPPFLEALRGAKAPPKFTTRFLGDLGFKSTNDRLFIPMLKGLRFIDDSGTPTQRYFSFLDDSRWKEVLGEGIHEAYEDLFRLNKKAHSLSKAELVGKLKSLTEGKLSENVISLMAKTFLELSKLADFSVGEPGLKQPSPDSKAHTEDGKHPKKAAPPPPAAPQAPLPQREPGERLINSLSYRIELVLPGVRDQAVFDAIFRSLKEHLL